MAKERRMTNEPYITDEDPGGRSGGSGQQRPHDRSGENLRDISDDSDFDEFEDAERMDEEEDESL